MFSFLMLLLLRPGRLRGNGPAGTCILLFSRRGSSSGRRLGSGSDVGLAAQLHGGKLRFFPWIRVINSRQRLTTLVFSSCRGIWK
jgi:hypothetical protein